MFNWFCRETLVRVRHEKAAPIPANRTQIEVRSTAESRRARRITARNAPRWGVKAWRRSESGVAAVEFAFVLPVLIMIMAGMIQFGAIFFLQNNMANAAREAARALAVKSIETEAESQKLVEQRLVNWGVRFDIDTTLPDPNNPADTDFTVVISAPLSEAAIFDFLGVFGGKTLSASASMREES